MCLKLTAKDSRDVLVCNRRMQYWQVCPCTHFMKESSLRFRQAFTEGSVEVEPLLERASSAESESNNSNACDLLRGLVWSPSSPSEVPKSKST